ncbi:MAG: hypothetical protein WC593_01875 [Methanoregula sp.]
MIPSEEFVKNLCEKSFLSLWCYPNPRSKDNKELCDFLVVCEPAIIIFSVKEIEFKDTIDLETALQRWRSRAIEKSVSQIYGAERWILKASNVITSEGEKALIFPDKDRCIYRIAVAFGSKRKVPVESKKFGKGFVHVFDEESLDTLLQELDTITDFIKYLKGKEEFQESGKGLCLEGGEEDLLAYYLINNRIFPAGLDQVLIPKGLWKQFSQSEGYRIKKDLEQISYAWDKFIEQQYSQFKKKTLLTTHTLDEFETAIRVIVKEDRFNRRSLCELFSDFFFMKKLKKGSARITTSMSGVTYVFQVNDEDLPREDRKAELEMRCILARGLRKENKTVIGIAT